MRIGIFYDSMSGNTEEVALIIQETLQSLGENPVIGNLRATLGNSTLGKNTEMYDILYLGSWTCDFGEMTDVLDDFIYFEKPLEKAKHIFSFGTGETQWGMENFCGAVAKIDSLLQESDMYEVEGIKVEQFPSSEKVISSIKEWTNKTYKESLK